MIEQIDASIIPYDSLIRGLCSTPYYGHSKGCPNVGCKEGCPPLPLLDAVYNLEKELYVIYTSFPVGEFAQRMKEAHPDWKESMYPDHPKKTAEFVNNIRAKLHKKHPEWPKEYYAPIQINEWQSARDWYNPRRWQGRARKEHNNELKTFQEKHPLLTIDACPEARGINLTGLMYALGVRLNWQWPPLHHEKNETYIISLAGYKK